MKDLSHFIPSPVVAVAASYQNTGKVDIHICGAEILQDNNLLLTFPSGHQLTDDQLITIHLDNRTGVAEYDADLRVYRLSYKGRVNSISKNRLVVCAIEFQVFYGIQIEYEFQEVGYSYPVDKRVSKDLPITPLFEMPRADPDEQENKVGVLITRAEGQPHTTVMAFLSSEEDDIFFITFPNTFKSKLLKKNNECYFAIDNRATFTFEHAIEWNYSIIKGSAMMIEKDSQLFQEVREEFIRKNPWEVGFFSHPDIEMFHLAPEKVICPSSSV